MASRRTAPRGDPKKGSNEVSEPADPPASRASSAPEPEEAAAASVAPAEGGLIYTLRQHAGFVLGLLSVFLLWYLYDEEGPWIMAKMLGCLVLCLVALVFHELRPFQVRQATEDFAAQYQEQHATTVSADAED